MVNKKLLTLFCILFIYAVRGYSQDLSLSEEEQAAFRAVFYAENERIPLDGLVTLDGQPYDVTVLQGNYVLVNMGATWCPYCNREKPTIERLYNGYFTEENFLILAIYLNERVETAGNYMREGGYHFPAAVDTTSRLRAEYAPRIPATYLIDPEGYIIFRVEGSREWDGETALKLIGSVLEGAGR